MKNVEVKDFTWVSSIALSPLVTEVTKSLKFSANSVSRAMDTVAGGVSKFGGYHRVHSGHSIADFSMWKKYGFKFPREVGIDFLTTNGLPLPGVETLVKKGYLTPGTATKWFSINIGDAACGILSVIDTGVNIYGRKKSDVGNKKIGILKCVTKVTVGIVTTNPVPIICGTIDLGMHLINQVESKIDFDLNYSPIQLT